MVQGYYTLQEAAQFLGMPPEELKQMAQRNLIRSFQDRGTWRFRVQDIQELARQRGTASDPDMHLGEAPPVRSPQPESAAKSPTPKSGPKSPPRSGPKSPPKSPKPKAPEVFDFAVDSGSDSDFGLALFDAPGSGGKKADSKKPESKKPASPVPPGSGSDIKLVAESSEI